MTTSRQRLPTALPLRRRQDEEDEAHNKPIVIIGGGVSGIYAALTLAERGYTNVTILESEMRVGGKAAAFEHEGRKYPLGAVGTPLALESASFTESQLFEKPAKFIASLLGRTGRRLQVLNANNLMLRGRKWPTPFPAAELKSKTPVRDWQAAFGRSGRPERFYPHLIDFASPRSANLAPASPLPQIVPRWGRPQTSWPLVYVSAHGYGVAQSADAPAYYYWARFAQKSTNAGAAGPLGMDGPLRYGPIGPRGPALRGWDSTSLFEGRLRAAGVQVRTGAAVSAIDRSGDTVRVTTTDGAVRAADKLILATDLKGALRFLDADEQERSLFSKIRHLPYYTVASFISLPWLATGSVYYLAEHQAPLNALDAKDAGRATAGCPTILLKANKGSNLTISWAYGGEGIGPPQMEACLRAAVLRMGGRFGGVRFIKRWGDYFPHVPANELRANFHRQLDTLQGRKRTYMVGEVFNLPLVSECVDWARYLVRRHFPHVAGTGGGGESGASPRAAAGLRRLRLFTRNPAGQPTALR